jgi:hypothetical protein
MFSPSKFSPPKGWIIARLNVEVMVPLEEGDPFMDDEEIRKHFEDKMWRRLIREATRSMLQDKLALTLKLDGVESRVP